MQHDLTAHRREKFRRVVAALEGGIGLDASLQAAAARVVETGAEDDERRFWAMVMTTPITLTSPNIEAKIRRAIEGAAA